MTKFKKWLDENPGMASALCKSLGINATNISNVKSGRKHMPARWINTVVRMSGRRVKHEDLIPMSSISHLANIKMPRRISDLEAFVSAVANSKRGSKPKHLHTV